MNDRIKQLAEKAEIDYGPRPEIARAPVWIATDEELEKFAELIIQECAHLSDCKNSFGHGSRAKILRYFGVEE
jgi:hypothetical protein